MGVRSHLDEGAEGLALKKQNRKALVTRAWEGLCTGVTERERSAGLGAQLDGGVNFSTPEH